MESASKSNASSVWKWRGAEDYKNEKLAYYQEQLKARGIPADAIKVFVAQVIEENGRLDESFIGDHGCSVGIPQRYVCDDGYSGKKFLATFAEWQDWRFQMRWMAEDAKGRWEKYGGNIKRAIVAHNCPACALASKDACYIGGVRQKKCYYERLSDNLPKLTL